MGTANVVLYAKYKYPNFSAVASSSDGTKLVAVADNSSGTNIGNIWTSVDSGATWTERATSRRWKCVASSSDGVKLVAGVWDGNIYTSTDSGETWTARDSNRKWISVASSADGSKLIAAANQDGFYLSTDAGVSWNRVVTATNAWTVTASSDGGQQNLPAALAAVPWLLACSALRARRSRTKHKRDACFVLCREALRAHLVTQNGFTD
jgi:hypothetical protein